MNFCPQCGTQLQPKGAYCGGCGTPVASAVGGSGASAPPMRMPQPAWAQPGVSYRRGPARQPGSGIAITAGILALVAVALFAIPNANNLNGYEGLWIADLNRLSALLGAIVLVTACILCLVTDTRRLGAAGLAGFASAAVTSSAPGLVGMVVNVEDLFEYLPEGNLTVLGGLVLLLVAAMLAMIVCLKGGIATGGVHQALLFGGGGLTLGFTVAKLWDPVSGYWIFDSEIKYWAPAVVLQTLLPFALVLVAALMVDRVARLVAVGSFALFSSLALWDWFDIYGRVRPAGWVSVVAVIGLAVLFAATSGVREPAARTAIKPTTW